MAAWLTRLLERLGASRPAGPASVQAERIDAVWAGRASLASASALFEALDRAVGPGPLDPAAVRRLAGHLRGGFGSEYAARGGHVEEHIAFWRRLADRTGHPAARGFLADCLLAAGRPGEAFDAFGQAFAVEPSLVHDFGDELEGVARSAGGAPWLDYRLACLHAALVAIDEADLVPAESPPGFAEDDGEEIRERYGELCEEYRADPAALSRIREVGRRIDAAVERGALPRALVRRAPR